MPIAKVLEASQANDENFYFVLQEELTRKPGEISRLTGKPINEITYRNLTFVNFNLIEGAVVEQDKLNCKILW